MMLIAESGSTKTYWVLLDHGKEEKSFTSAGLNPYTQSKSAIAKYIKEEVFTKVEGKIDTIHFYGAGCSTVKNCNIVKDALSLCFPSAEIAVRHDILAAAVGLFGNENGIAIILGTGSNSCYYDGREVLEGIPALGYILGDEGSGAWLGKKLIHDFLYLELPAELHQSLAETYKLDKESILNAVYKLPNPNRWLASFAPFIDKNLNSPYCRELVKETFSLFFKYHVSRFDSYRELPLRSVGSVGYYFKDILEEVAREYGFQLDKVLQSPMKGLMEFHGKANH